MSFVLVLALGLAALPAAKDREWQDGKLTDMQKESAGQIYKASDPIGLSSGRAVNLVTYSYRIEVADRFYVAEMPAGTKYGGLSTVPNDPIDLDVNGPVKFAVEKQALYLKDRRGKEYRLRILKQGLL